MAIPATGSVSMSAIQSEWGGSNPISINEYYSGSLASNNNPDSESPSVSYTSTSVFTPANPGSKGVPGTPAYTSYYRQFGYKNTNISNTSAYPAFGAASQAYATLTGIDQVGEAGQIPSSGAIQFNHFRGTTGSGTTTTVTTYAIMGVQAYSNPPSSSFGNLSMQVYISGTYGTNYQTGDNWANVPFRYIDLAAKDGFPATRLYGSDNHQNSGWVTAKNTLYHNTFPNIGATTRYTWTTNNNTNINMSGTWTISITT